MTILRFLGPFVVVGALFGLMASPLTAAQNIVFSDDFEDDTIGVGGPNAPPVGDYWNLYFPATVEVAITANPESEVGKNESTKALRITRSSTSSLQGFVQAMLTSADQDLLETAGNVTVEYKYYDMGGNYSWGVHTMAKTGGPSALGDAPADMSIRNLYGDKYWIGSPGQAWSDLIYEPETWQDYKIEIDLKTAEWTVTLDGTKQATPTKYIGTLASTITDVLFYPGSYDCEGYIDDVVIWTDYAPPIPGDINGDGYVDDKDAKILAANWHRGVPPGSTSSASGTVPEPGTLIGLLSMGLVGGLCWFMRRSR